MMVIATVKGNARNICVSLWESGSWNVVCVV
jgi:hypothetical protein